MTIATTRVLMDPDKFQIDGRGVEDERLEYPLNNWLAEQGKYNVLAGATIGHLVAGQPNKGDSIPIMRQDPESSQSLAATNLLFRNRNDIYGKPAQEQERDMRLIATDSHFNEFSKDP